jgi:hypothetical protein
MKILPFTLLFLCGCGAYIGLDGFHYFPDGLPVEAKDAAVTIIPEAAVRAGLTGLMGPFAPYASVILGALSIFTTMFVTKRKKRE